MPSLDVRGKIAAAEIGFHAPIAILTLLLVFRYAFRRDAGWFFLLIFSACELLIMGGILLKTPYALYSTDHRRSAPHCRRIK